MKKYKHNYEIGDIVFVSKYAYDKNNNGENHLFVIIDDDKIEAVTVEYFGMIVSSHREKCKNNSNFEYNEPLDSNINNGLKVDSIVKCDDIYSIKPESIRFKIGSVDVDDYLRFITSYSRLLKKSKTKISNV